MIIEIKLEDEDVSLRDIVCSMSNKNEKHHLLRPFVFRIPARIKGFRATFSPSFAPFRVYCNKSIPLSAGRF